MSEQFISMREYTEYIKNLALSKRDAIFYNTGAIHAAFVMSTIFNTAQEKVQIFAGNFSGAVSRNAIYRESLSDFLTRNGKLEVLLNENKLLTYKTENSETDPQIFDLLRFYNIVKPGNVVVKTYRETSVEQEEFHFTVGDNTMYRLEYDITNFKAEGNFNNPEEANRLATVFNEIFNSDKAKPVSLDLK